MKRTLATLLAMVMALSLCACSSASETEEAVDLRTLSLEEITEKAQEIGSFETVGMPDTWTHWDYSWAAILDMYGLEHADTDMSSGEEIALFAAEMDDPTKDMGDVGIGFTITAMEEDVLQPYKVSVWDEIPDWAKDADGYWACSYTGTTCFIYNTDQTDGQVPTTWAELLESDIMVTPGTVVTGASSQVNVLACAIAMGGSFDNVQPGIDYFKTLAEQGRLDPGTGNRTRLSTGEIQCMIGRFDFDGAVYEVEVNAENIDGVTVESTIPQDGAITTGYAQIINKYAPNAYAAALSLEYLFSDEGQIDRAYGGARPIRSDVEIPDDVPLMDDSLYNNVTFAASPAELQAACDQISILWQEEIIPLLG